MRATKKQFYAVVERLSNVMSVELTTQVSHKHYAIYAGGPDGSLSDQLVVSDRLRDAIDQSWAILNAIRVLEKKREKERKMVENILLGEKAYE